MPLSQHPCQRELGGGDPLLVRDLFDLFDELDVLAEILTLKSRAVAPVVVFRQVVEFPDLAGQEAAAKRRLRHETNTEFAARREDIIIFDIARPHAVFALQSSDRVNGRSTPERFGRSFG